MSSTFTDTGSAPAAPQAPAGHRGNRAAVLLHLKRQGTATASGIAESLECSLNAVRHHLRELEGEGVVRHERTHHGVGAPVHAYRLSAAGHALFPDRYGATVGHLLDRLVELQGREASVATLRQHFGALGARLCGETAPLGAAERGERIAQSLDAEGFMATWRADEAGGVLIEHNCPHRLVAERFPEVCAAEEVFLSEAFGVTVERQSRIADGCGTCSYRVALQPAESEDDK